MTALVTVVVNPETVIKEDDVERARWTLMGHAGSLHPQLHSFSCAVIDLIADTVEPLRNGEEDLLVANAILEAGVQLRVDDNYLVIVNDRPRKTSIALNLDSPTSRQLVMDLFKNRLIDAIDDSVTDPLFSGTLPSNELLKLGNEFKRLEHIAEDAEVDGDSEVAESAKALADEVLGRIAWILCKLEYESYAKPQPVT